MIGDSTELLLGTGVAVLLGALVVLQVRRRATQAPGTAPQEASRPTRPGGALRRGLLAAGQRLGVQLEAILAGAGAPDAHLRAVEEVLIAADVGVRTSGQLVERIRGSVMAPSTPEAIRAALRAEIVSMFPPPRNAAVVPRPRMMMVTGVNGVGKTTTVGKLAAAAVARGERVLLVAADTYRAAAIEQLEVWGRRLDVDIVRHGAGASPAAVAFDGATAGVARGVDLVLFDTAGRLHTRTPLMEELRKVHRVVGQVCPGAPHDVLLVLDATTGQNAIVQARAFREAVAVTGVVLTKLDGTAKGGVALAVTNELGLPILYVGVGEGVADLQPFDPDEYAEALVGTAG